MKTLAKVLAGLTLIGPTFPQEIIRTWDDYTIRISSVESAGDVDLDGVADLLIAETAQNNFFGRVSIVSGADMTLIREHSGTNLTDLFGFKTSTAGDVNGDGVPDVLIAAPQVGTFPMWGEVYVHSGLDGTLLHTFQSTQTDTQVGYDLGPAGDVDADGQGDFWIMSRKRIGSEYRHVLTVYSGATFSEIYSKPNYLDSATFGYVGDVNGDGRDDMGVVQTSTVLRVLSGLDGSMIHTIAQGTVGEAFRSIGAIGDLDQDGFDDVLVGGLNFAFGAMVYSGATGGLLLSVTSDSVDQHQGGHAYGMGDVNLDSVPDFALVPRSFGSDTPNSTHVTVYSGANGAQIGNLFDVGNDSGIYAAATGDMNGDGMGQLVLTQETPVTGTSFWTREVNVYSGFTTEFGSTYCQATSNSTGTAAVINAYLGAPGVNVHLDAYGGPPGEYGYFLVGDQATNQNPALNSNGNFCLRTTGGAIVGRYNASGTNRMSLGRFGADGLLQNQVGTSATGSGFDLPNELPFPGTPLITAGATYHFQLWYRDTPAGSGSSNFSSAVTLGF